MSAMVARQPEFAAPGVATTAPRTFGLTHDTVVVALVLIAALAIRVHGLTAESFWVDEGATVTFMQAPLAYQWGEMPGYETNPPGYYTLMKGWSALFGGSDTALRAPGAIAGALCVLPVYFIALGVAGRRAAFAAAALVALSAVSVRYAQEARAFMPVTLAALCALWAATALAGRVASGVRTRAPFWAMVAGLALLPYLHYSAYLAVAAVLVALGTQLVLRGVAPAHMLRTVLTAGGAVALLSAPCLYFVYTQLGSGAVAVGWIDHPTLADSHAIYRAVFGYTALTPPESGALAALLPGEAGLRRGANAVLLATAATGIVLGAHRRAWVVPATAMALAFAIVAFHLVSQLQPILLPRVVVWMVPWLLLLAGCALGWLPAPVARVVLFVLLVLQAANLAAAVDRQRGEPWRELVGTAGAAYTPGDAIVIIGTAVAVPALVDRYWPAAAAGEVPERLYMVHAAHPHLRRVTPALHGRIEYLDAEAPCPALRGGGALHVVFRHATTASAMHETLGAHLVAAGAVRGDSHVFERLALERWSRPRC